MHSKVENGANTRKICDTSSFGGKNTSSTASDIDKLSFCMLCMPDRP